MIVKVTNIPNAEKIIVGDANVTFVAIDEIYRAQVGYPIGYFYGLKTAGIFQNEAVVAKAIPMTKAK